VYIEYFSSSSKTSTFPSLTLIKESPKSDAATSNSVPLTDAIPVGVLTINSSFLLI